MNISKIVKKTMYEHFEECYKTMYEYFEKWQKNNV